MVRISILVNAILGAVFVNSTHLLRHDKRDVVPSAWTLQGRALGETKVKARVALAQQNVEHGAKHLLDISDPFSSTYGKHWTREQVADFFKPSPPAIKAVREWLAESGVHVNRHRVSPGQGSIQFTTTVAELERLLGAEYHVYEDSATGSMSFSCQEYYLPDHVAHHVDFITPSLGFSKLQRRGLSGRDVPYSDIQLAQTSATGPASATTNLSDCYQAVTPDCIRALYNIPSNFTTEPDNQLGIVTYFPYQPSDLDEFFQLYTDIPPGTRPLEISIDGAPTSSPNYVTEEPSIDIDAAFPIVYPQNITWFGDQQIDSDVDEFLDAVDGSYCSFEGGDVAPYDPSYPNQYYNQSEMCGVYNITNVVSVSYYSVEVFLPFSYQRRQCDEYMKLALQGVTFVFCSGDYGASCVNDTNNQPVLSASFPASCPWVTAVGATQILNNTPPTQPEAAVIFPNSLGNFTSGGGFSAIFDRPSYQNTSVSSYLSNYLPDSAVNHSLYNTTGRAVPDVALNGFNFVNIIKGAVRLNYGTSVGTPIFAAMIALVNSARKEAGKGPVGFINPVLYANTGMFNDVILGNSTGCDNTVAFNATPGWDPVTGLGTPDFPKLLDVFMSLP